MPEDFLFKTQKLSSKKEFRHPIIGLGAQSKTSLALARGRDIFISEPCSDLNDAVEFEKFENILKSFRGMAGVKHFAFDLHPSYSYRQLIYDYSLKGAKGIKFSGIQHHQAHIASCYFENNLQDKVIGVAFDGTGFGSDGNLWGGEFFTGNLKSFERAAHLSYIPLIGGEEAILEPWRISAALLYTIYRERFLDLKIGFVRSLDKKKWPALRTMLEKKINCPKSSSAGRLFDAVSALLGLVKTKINYEAEGPIKLEKLARNFKAPGLKGLYYNSRIRQDSGAWVVDTAQVISEIVSDLKNGVGLEKIAFKFHNSLAKIIFSTATLIRQSTAVNRVVLSGGVFQNKLLSSLTRDLLVKKGFKVFEHSKLSSSDASICLGQVILADSRGM